jgi:hypothetical protein
MCLFSLQLTLFPSVLRKLVLDGFGVEGAAVGGEDFCRFHPQD